MPSYKTITQILITTSAVGSALAAPLTAQEMHDARADLFQLVRRMNSENKKIFYTAPLAGLVAGTIGGLASSGQKWLTAYVPSENDPRDTLFQRSVGTDHISRSLAALSDDDLQLLSYVSRRTLESLD